ncbi:hypothetical protein HAX54_031370 [Datura stramonium]|uniref:Uncharacterized protein n=1 Tax=Datura stramonium TaxID=4076 RepID=A0ABS8V9X6_DATST|nr:hypothetical protein [Datura stramonium]
MAYSKIKDTATNYAMVMKAEKWKNEEEWDQNMTHLKIQLELITKNLTTMNTQKVHAVNAHKKCLCMTIITLIWKRRLFFSTISDFQANTPGSNQHSGIKAKKIKKNDRNGVYVSPRAREPAANDSSSELKATRLSRGAESHLTLRKGRQKGTLLGNTFLNPGTRALHIITTSIEIVLFILDPKGAAGEKESLLVNIPLIEALEQHQGKVDERSVTRKRGCEHKFDAACNIQEDGPGSTQMNINAATHGQPQNNDTRGHIVKWSLTSLSYWVIHSGHCKALVDAERSDLEFRLNGQEVMFKVSQYSKMPKRLEVVSVKNSMDERVSLEALRVVGPSFEEPFDDDDLTDIEQARADLESDGDDGKDL